MGWRLGRASQNGKHVRAGNSLRAPGAQSGAGGWAGPWGVVCEAVAKPDGPLPMGGTRAALVRLRWRSIGCRVQ